MILMRLLCLLIYRVPQALVHLNMLSYTPACLKLLKRPVASGSEVEVEIRCCSIWVVELVRREIVRLGGTANAILLDFYLWDLAKGSAEEMKSIPIHKTRSVY